ncbi:isoprenylcysteine carboxyl methyltransferase family protein [Anaeromyxobacter oryzae]|uniref:isoprenylcysteine carboxyl methyltransferase family protein n=1 Tax=Anaeromyxobacter oryzae TaxID=2918170 RepID=UPI00298C4A90|nr:isoprenylcysteine carboxylmethyltransferase family protein [Anaeromyxobacter oryzae]
MTARAIGYALLGLVALERVVELAVSTRNARRTLARGGVERGRGHYPVMVAFHAGVLAACAAEPVVWPEPAWPVAATAGAALAVAAAQALRWWAVGTLGERWSTRIVVVPGAAPVVSGPYRWLRHPNYVAVAVELAALPLALGAWRTAIAATLGNAALMAIRIPAEERALGPAWAAAFAARPRGGGP